MAHPADHSLGHEVSTALHRPEGAALVPATFLAFGLLDAVPIPTDIGYFYVQKWLDENRERLTSREFWFYTYLNYYAWDVAWYLSLAAVTYFGAKSMSRRIRLGLGVISVGATVAIIWRFARARAEPQQVPAVPEAPTA